MSSKKTTKPPCGMRDFGPSDVLIREKIFDIAKEHFVLYGGNPIETPAMEIIDGIRDLYGEEFNKLVYKLDKDKSETLIMRYDLTYPFIRYCANNGIENFRRYQIGKVYRKDNPQIEKGRYREFYQCDFDIVGSDNETRVYDIEILSLLQKILAKVIGEDTFIIEYNDREIVHDILNAANISSNEYATVCSSLDKLDKHSWEYVEKELIDVKKIIPYSVEFLKEIVNKIQENRFSELINTSISQSSYDKLQNINYLIDTLGISKCFKFNPLLIRGLDYYTGIIYEAVYKDKNIMPSSIASGGRYDKMLGRLSNKKNIPAIGMSLGIERLVTILEKTSEKQPSQIFPKVYVAGVGKNTLISRIKLCDKLRKKNISVQMCAKNNPKMGPQLNFVLENKIPYMLVLGENEINKGTIMFKDIVKEEQIEISQVDIFDKLI